MKITNAMKQQVCEKYNLYLNIIYHFGNKVMLPRQLFEFANAFNVQQNYALFEAQIQELVDAQIVKIESFDAFGKKPRPKMLVLCKYAIRFLENKSGSNKVGAVPKANSTDRIMLSIFKNVYIMNKLIPRIVKLEKEVSFDNLRWLLEQDHSSIAFNKNQGLEYLKALGEEFLKKHHFDMDYLNSEIERMERLQNKRKDGLTKGAKSTVGKGKQHKLVSSAKNNSDKDSYADVLAIGVQKSKSKLEQENAKGQTQVIIEDNKVRKLKTYNFDSMLSSFAYICQMKIVKGVFHITVTLFDIKNTQNINNLAINIACLYEMLFQYLQCDFKLKVGIIGVDEQSEKNMKVQSQISVIDRYSREKRGERLEVTLKNWEIDSKKRENIDIQITNYNIINRYFGGGKESNLIRK